MADSDADRAYAAAQRLIAQAKADGATELSFDNSETHALTNLPPEIGSLTALEWLSLDNTSVTDLSPLQDLTALTELYLNNTSVKDLSPLQNLTALTRLYLNNTPITDLTPLQTLTALTMLFLDSTPITDLIPLQDLTTLTRLDLDNTPVTDLTPLRGLSGLTKDGLEPWQGLHFKNSAACRADPRIAEIAGIEDSAERARTLFAYLEDWLPPGDGADAPLDEAQSRMPKDGAFVRLAKRISVQEIKTVLSESFPDIRDRTQHIMALIQQERANHAMIPRPNADPALKDYEEKEEFLKTVEAGLLSLYAELPETPENPISDTKATCLKEKLQQLAQLTDASIQYLDKDTGTYGGLYKIGLIGCASGLLSLFGLPLAVAAPVAGGVLGVQTMRVHLSKD